MTLQERVALAMAKVISKRHGHDDNGDSWLNDQRREEAQAAIEATGVVELRDKAENLIIAIGMGWDLDGCVEALQTQLTKGSE